MNLNLTGFDGIYGLADNFARVFNNPLRRMLKSGVIRHHMFALWLKRLNFTHCVTCKKLRGFFFSLITPHLSVFSQGSTFLPTENLRKPLVF